MASDWFNTLWKKRIPTTVNTSQVPSTQTNFPLLINSIFPELIGATLDELRFAGVDKVQLGYEIQKFDSITGELIAWVRKPTISDNDITYIYYDNPAVVDEQDPASVWNINYKAVYHGQNDGKDSTFNPQQLTQFGTAQTPVPGKIGNGMNYGGTVSDYSIRNPFDGFPSIAITAEYWIKTLGAGDGMVSYAVGGFGFDDHFLTATQENLQVFLQNVGVNVLVNFSDGLFHHIVVTWRSSDGQFITYVDGVSIFSVISQIGATFTANGSLVLGQDQDNVGGGFDGT